MAYNKKIVLQVCSGECDEIGNQGGDWCELRSVWAEIFTVSGKEYYAAAQTNSENDVTFRIRYSADIAAYADDTDSIRLVYGGRIFDIRSITDVKERHLTLEIRAVSINAGQGE